MNSSPRVQFDRLGSGQRVRVLLLNPPSRSIEYPSPSIAAVCAALREEGVCYGVVDLNAQLKDHFLTKACLEGLLEDGLPSLMRLSAAFPERIRAVYHLRHSLSAVQRFPGFAVLEHYKSLLQSRQYEAALCAPYAFEVGGAFFNTLRDIHSYLTLAGAMAAQGFWDELRGPLRDFFDSALDIVCGGAPEIVGISCMSIQRPFVYWLATAIKRRANCRVVVGGPDATRYARSYVESCEAVDDVFVGPAAREFARFSGGSRIRDADGQVHRSSKDEARALRACPERPVEPLRLVFDEFELERYLFPVLPLATSSGCSWRRCDFCDHWRHSPTYVKHEPEHVAAEALHLRERYGARLFHFLDDGLDAAHGCAVLARIRRAVPDARILTYARPDETMNRHVLESWYDGGVRVIEWGLETTSKRLLDKMKKGITPACVRRVVADSASIGIVNKLMMFHGYPSETLEELQASLLFLEQLYLGGQIRPFFPVRCMLELRKGTQLYRSARRGRLFPKVWWPHGSFPDRAFYAVDQRLYQRKVALLDSFLARARAAMRRGCVLTTDDENLFLDLILCDLTERGSSPNIETHCCPPEQ